MNAPVLLHAQPEQALLLLQLPTAHVLLVAMVLGDRTPWQWPMLQT
jgi:hypothetical protein